MTQWHNGLIAALWVTWLAYWLLSAAGAKVTERRESRVSRLTYSIPLAAGVILTVWEHVPVPVAWFSIRILPAGDTTYWIGVLLLAFGLGFAAWARRHLGRNWSGTVTLKKDHELIKTGPYRWVRHPIYTGLLVAVAGCAIVRGELRVVLGLLLVIVSLVWKLRVEERWMRERFGAAYEQYSTQVPALIPGMF